MLAPNFLELDHYVWKALCLWCSKACAKARATGGIASIIARTAQYEGDVTMSSSVIGRIILSTAHMCIIPWVEWSPSNHLHVTHKGLQLVTRKALLVLLRNGIHGDIALSILQIVMTAMQDRQAVLHRYAWDDMIVAYEKFMQRAIK